MTLKSEFVRLKNIVINPLSRESHVLSAGEYIDDIFFDVVPNCHFLDVRVSDPVIQSKRTVLLNNNDEKHEHNIAIKIKRIITEDDL